MRHWLLAALAVLFLAGCDRPLCARFRVGDVVELKGTGMRAVVHDSTCTAFKCTYNLKPLERDDSWPSRGYVIVPEVVLEPIRRVR